MTKLYLDTETFSEIPLKHGVHNYAAGVEVMLVQYAIDDGPEVVWDRTGAQRMPSDLEDAVYDERVPVVIANSQFDRTVVTADEVFPGLDMRPERICDTMLQAYLHGLPGAMEKLGIIFGLREEEAKIKEGRQLRMSYYLCCSWGGQPGVIGCHFDWSGRSFVTIPARRSHHLRRLHRTGC